LLLQLRRAHPATAQILRLWLEQFTTDGGNSGDSIEIARSYERIHGGSQSDLQA